MEVWFSRAMKASASHSIAVKGSPIFSAAVSMARRLKRRISVEVGLTASIGIGNSKLVAKLASAYDKPDGLTWIRPDQVRQFLDPQPVRRLPGVGPSTAARLQDAEILTIGQLRRAPLALLALLFTSSVLGRG